MRFVKTEGCGNDFVMVDCFRQSAPEAPARAAAAVCDRHFGVGADGLVLLLPGADTDAEMRIYNSDGSEAEMCGNATRCIGKYLYETGLVPRREMTLQTRGGVRRIRVNAEDGRVSSVRVDMGAPEFAPERIPVAGGVNRVTREMDGREALFFCVSMGNPHAVTFDLFPEGDRFRALGARMETDAAFPRKTNVEFCRALARDRVRVRVWERGCGPTLACGTGACAVLAAGASLGILDREADVELPGGTLRMAWEADGHLYMTGPAREVFRGEIDL